MPIKTRDLDLRLDRNELVRFLYENLNKQLDSARFAWLYLDNPFGQARAWIAVDEVDGRTVGLAAAFPRPVWIDVKPLRAWVLGDFCIAANSRSLGPALLLQRACLAFLAKEEAPIWYDFPSHSMLAVYRRLGIPIVGNHIRYVKLIRINAKVRSYIPNTSLARTISVVGNLALRLQQSPQPFACDVEVALHEGNFGEEFTKLDSRMASLYPIRGLRSAEYLNWRYRHNPAHRYQVIVVKRGAHLLAYAVFEVAGTDWTLTDLDALEEAKTVPAILAYVDQLARAAGVDRVTAPVMEGSPLSSNLRRAGFYPRESVPVVASFGDSRSPFRAQNTSAWFLMHGDRES